MNKHNFLIILISTVVLIFIILISFLSLNYFNSDKLQSSFVFATTIDNGNDLNKIAIKTAKSSTSIVLKDDYWVLPDKSDYYIDFVLINKILTAVNTAYFFQKLPYDTSLIKKHHLLDPTLSTQDSGILVTTYQDNKKLDEIIIGNFSKDHKYLFARRKDKQEIWLIDGKINFDLPRFTKDYISNPILLFNQRKVESLTLDKKEVLRETQGAKFYFSNSRLIDITSILNTLSNLKAEDIKKNIPAEFLKDYSLKTYTVTFFSGLQIIFKAYVKEDLWLNIKLSATSLPYEEVNDYIDNNSFLYDGWYFKLPVTQKERLQYYRFM